MKSYTAEGRLSLMDIEKLKEKKRALGYTNEDVARLSGVPLGTVQKVFAGVTKNPRRETVIALAGVLDQDMAEGLQSNEAKQLSEASKIGETLAAYYTEHIDGQKIENHDGKDINGFKQKKQGEYTIEDYYQLPDDVRAELIDGVIYLMTAPLSEHQLAVGEIYHQLKSCAEEHDMPCIPAIAPFDVQLDKDEKSMLQPDVMIACDEELMQRRGIYGAPEFVLEVLSPSTRSKDQVIKLKKYQEAGCEEYWIVDIENRRVLVYLFKDENWPDIYSFDDRVPVGISEGLCEIDFTKVEKEIARVQGIKE